MFEIKNVSKRYGEEYALRGVSLAIGKGLHYIVGASGSGKTTLLRIITGMEPDFEGDVLYRGRSVKELSSREKSYYYNNVFGFVWQDFNLLEERTVLENVMLPQHLGKGPDRKAAMRALRELKISELADQKAGTLSGGQKQRAAIARELVKNPQVILADEPTSALDGKSSKITMDILQNIAKTRTVIVVTHDLSLIGPGAKVFELDKGELVCAPEVPAAQTGGLDARRPHRLPLSRAWSLGVRGARSKWGRFAASVASLLASAVLLLVTVSGAVSSSGQDAFDDLFAAYGRGLLDISLAGSFISASGAGGGQSDQPSADVSQDIDGLYEKYAQDERVSHIVFTQPFHDIRITLDGSVYDVGNSGSVPVVNELTAGVMPGGDGREVVVPQSFVRVLGLTDGQALGKTISFAGAIYNWESGAPVLTPVGIDAVIVGVADTTVRYEAQGEMRAYSVDDSFFFSKPALEELRAQAGLDGGGNFSLRARTPADMISIKDELNADGIVPLGRFELVEDIVRLNQQTANLSGSAMAVIGALAAAAALGVSLATALTRRREYAIYRVSGYGARHLALLTAMESALAALACALLFLCASPLLNLATSALWNVKILSPGALALGVLLALAAGALACAAALPVAAGTEASSALRTGDR